MDKVFFSKEDCDWLLETLKTMPQDETTDAIREAIEELSVIVESKDLAKTLSRKPE